MAKMKESATGYLELCLKNINKCEVMLCSESFGRPAQPTGFSLQNEKKKESVNQFAKIGKLCSESTVIKKFSIIAEVPTITAFVAAFDAKALNCMELLESYFAGGNRIINCHRQTNRNRHN